MNNPPFWPTQFEYKEFLQRWESYGVTHKDVVGFLESLRVTKQDQIDILTSKQRSEKWFQSRGKRLTASNFGAVCGQNPFSRPKQVLKNMLWPSFFTCAAVQWGQDNETTAANIFEEAIRKQDPEIDKISYPGLIVSVEVPWLGASPDGIVHLKNGKMKGLEIKCPFKKELYPYIPSYYYAQIMGSSGLLGLPSYYFVVWTPDVTEISEYAFHREYFFQVMMPAMEEFYFLQYLPLAILKDKGLLAEGQIDPKLKISKAVDEESEQQSQEVPDFIF